MGYEYYRKGNKVGAAAMTTLYSFYDFANTLSFGTLEDGSVELEKNQSFSDAASNFAKKQVTKAEKYAEEVVVGGVVAGTAKVAKDLACSRAKAVCKTVEKGIKEAKDKAGQAISTTVETVKNIPQKVKHVVKKAGDNVMQPSPGPIARQMGSVGNVDSNKFVENLGENATKEKSMLPILPDGYHYRTTNGKTIVAKNKGQKSLPKLSLTGDDNLYSPLPTPLSNRPLYLYQKVNEKGEHQKFGVTVDLEGRYTARELGGGKLRKLSKGERKKILSLERSLHKNLPIGPEEKQAIYREIQRRKGLKP